MDFNVPITSNDQSFNCGGACSNGINENIGLVNLNAKFLNIEEIRDNLTQLISSVSEAVTDVFRWVDFLESDFAIRYTANEITNDISLFNQINVAIVKIKRLKGMLDSWLNEFHRTILDTSELLNDYGIAMSILRSDALSSTLNIGQTAVALAKNNLSKSRSINKQIKKILKIDNTIKTNLIKIRSMIESFYTGSIKVGDKILNFKEFERIIKGLTNTDTPLKQIQARLATDINSQNKTFQIDSVQPAPINVPANNEIYGITIEEENVDRTIEQLRKIQSFTLYTDNTKAQIDRIAEQASVIYKSNPRFPIIQRIFDEIRSQTPAKVIDYYRMNVRNDQGRFLRLENLKRLMDNLHASDIIYRPILKSIYDEMLQDIESDRDFPMRDNI